jgi:hypothetical protein
VGVNVEVGDGVRVRVCVSVGAFVFVDLGVKVLVGLSEGEGDCVGEGVFEGVGPCCDFVFMCEGLVREKLKLLSSRIGRSRYGDGKCWGTYGMSRLSINLVAVYRNPDLPA